MTDLGNYTLLTARGRAKAKTLAPLLIPGVGEADAAGLAKKAVGGFSSRGAASGPSVPAGAPPTGSAPFLVHFKPERWVVKRAKNGSVSYTHRPATGLTGHEVAGVVMAGAVAYGVYESLKIANGWLQTLGGSSSSLGTWADVIGLLHVL